MSPQRDTVRVRWRSWAAVRANEDPCMRGYVYQINQLCDHCIRTNGTAGKIFAGIR
jgi:hypothetical protein